AATQIGCALALLLLVPLGDRMDRHRLMAVQLFALVGALVAVGTAQSASALLAGMLCVGMLGTAMTQGLIAYAATAAASGEQGSVVGAAMSGEGTASTRYPGVADVCRLQHLLECVGIVAKRATLQFFAYDHRRVWSGRRGGGAGCGTGREVGRSWTWPAHQCGGTRRAGAGLVAVVAAGALVGSLDCWNDPARPGRPGTARY